MRVQEIKMDNLQEKPLHNNRPIGNILPDTEPMNLRLEIATRIYCANPHSYDKLEHFFIKADELIKVEKETRK